MAKVQSIDLPNTSAAYHAPATVAPSANTIQISGQIGSAQDGSVPNDYESQIQLALLNLRKVIMVAGASIKDITKLTIYIVDYDASNRKHTRHVQKFLNGHRPAITLVPVAKLAMPQWLFEIDAVVAQPISSPRIDTAVSVPMESFDVVIIGAGLAGLSAAYSLLRAGLSCVILEARDRVGGKTWSEKLTSGKGTVDLGAAWINDTNQIKMYELARKFGADLIKQNTTGKCVLQDSRGIVSSFAYGDLPGFDHMTQENIMGIRDMAEKECQELDAWQPKNAKLDAMTFKAYLQSRGAGEEAINTATVWTRAMLGQEPEDVSALFFLNYCKSGGGLLQMRSDRKDGGQYLRVRQGTQLFAKGLAADLPAGTIRLSQPVLSIEQQNDSRTTLVRIGGATLSARKVITTIPSPALRTVSFQPPLPPPKRLWIDSAGYGYYTKAMLVFTTPFWVEAGFCGLTQSFVGPADVIRDTSIPAESKFVLTCFLAAGHGRDWSALPSDHAKAAALLAQLEKLYSITDLSSKFISMSYYEWNNDEWSGFGCPCASLPPGVLDAVGADALRKPFGDVHFAGTETAGEWKGYMEGAVRSGERAATEVIQDLKLSTSSKL